MPPIYFISLVIISFFLDKFLPIKEIIPTPYHYTGTILICFGAILNFWANYYYKTRRTTVKPYERPSHFITDGPFRISRNPMYLGMTSILLGWAIYLGSPLPFLSPIIFILVIELTIIPMEEKNLLKVFGEKYLNYENRVRRWI